MMSYCQKKLEVETALLSVQLPGPSPARKSAVMGHAFLTEIAEQLPFLSLCVKFVHNGLSS